METKTRIGVVGVGYLGRFHALIYSRMPNVELIGVVDLDKDRAHKIAQEAGCSAFTDANELLDKVDAISVVVPTSAHLQMAIV